MNALSPIYSRNERPDHRLRPMRGRIAFHVKTARLTATERSQGAHLTINMSFLGSTDTTPAASIDTDLGTGAIQIAIAGSTG